jgi:hypothetical protein
MRRDIRGQRNPKQHRQRLPDRNDLQRPPALPRRRDHRRRRHRRAGECPGADRQHRAHRHQHREQRRNRHQQRAHREAKLGACQNPAAPDPTQHHRQQRNADRIGERIADHYEAGLPDRHPEIFADRGQEPRDQPTLGTADESRQREPEQSTIHQSPTPQAYGEVFETRRAARSEYKATGAGITPRARHLLQTCRANRRYWPIVLSPPVTGSMIVLTRVMRFAGKPLSSA